MESLIRRLPIFHLETLKWLRQTLPASMSFGKLFAMSMDFIRKQQKSIVTTIIFGVIILSFILWTGQDHSSTRSGQWVSVNGHEISLKTFQQALAQQTRMFSQFMQGQPINEELMKMIERQVAMNLIMEELMVHEAKKTGIIVGSEEIVDELKNETAFHDPKLKRFSPSVYERILKANELEPREFERDIAHKITSNRFRDVLEWAGSISQAELEDTQRIENHNFDLKILTFDPASLASSKKLVAKPSELRAYYEKNKGIFRSEARRKIEAWALDVNNIKISLDPTRIEKYFDELKAAKGPSNTLGVGAQVHALHILINDMSPAGLKRMKDLAATLRTEAQFRSAARRLSEDYSNASQGGDLGYFGKDAMVKPFAEAAFNPASPLGKVLGPIKTNYGYHLIWLIDRTGADLTLQARRTQVGYLLSKQAKKEEAEKVKGQIQKAIAHPSDLPKTISALGFENLGFATIDRKNSGAIPFMVAQSAMTSKLNEWKGPDEASDRIFVYRAVEEIAAQEMSFEAAESQVRQKWESEKTEALVKGLQASYTKGESSLADILKMASNVQDLKSFRPYQTPLPAPLDQADILAKAAQSLTKKQTISTALFHEGKWTLLVGSHFQDTLPEPVTSAAASKAPKGAQVVASSTKMTPSENSGKSLEKLREEMLSRKRAAFFEAYSQRLLQEAKMPNDFRKRYGLDRS